MSLANRFSTLELCAGAGGQALGLEMAGFCHVGLVENDAWACKTLRLNRADWNVVEHDLFESFKWSAFKGVDVLAGGLPCPPFSIAGKQLGQNDERNLFDIGINLIDELRPNAVMFENVKGLLEPRFETYRTWIALRLEKLGYVSQWKLIHSSDFGVPQLRPRVLLIAMKRQFSSAFVWPQPKIAAASVGETLVDLMAENGWYNASNWAARADKIAPTIVGGSKKHGGPDLGPTRARKAWELLGVDGRGLANDSPSREFRGMPRLTDRMVARLQGFPDGWQFAGGKTARYRQIGNAFPPPVASEIGRSIAFALSSRVTRQAIGA